MNFDKKPYKLFRGDCIEVMKTLPANSIDALVTDPPYGWRFMGKAWDGADIVEKAKREKTSAQKLGEFKGPLRGISKPSSSAGEYDLSQSANFAFQKWTEEWAREALRILKPGAHALIFCGPRTYHRMATGVEDAGFEIRDQLQWIFGSGFPKSLDISKGIDKCFGGKREVTGQETKARSEGGKSALPTLGNKTVYKSWDKHDNPVTAAAAWKGWGTSLKPANEPIVLARKPLEKKTVAKNVLRYGTGGLNIDAGRIGTSDNLGRGGYDPSGKSKKDLRDATSYASKPMRQEFVQPAGRFPSNVLLDEEAARMLDEQSGILKNGGRNSGSPDTIGMFGVRKSGNTELAGDSGGASRFFYVAKTSKHERNYGVSSKAKVTTDGRNKPIDNAFLRGETERQNSHPTVKPFKLMRYLIRLITPPGGIVLEPFLGSGTTGAVAVACGYKFIGIEREAEYFEIARARIKDVKLKIPAISGGNQDGKKTSKSGRAL